MMAPWIFGEADGNLLTVLSTLFLDPLRGLISYHHAAQLFITCSGHAAPQTQLHYSLWLKSGKNKGKIWFIQDGMNHLEVHRLICTGMNNMKLQPLCMYLRSCP